MENSEHILAAWLCYTYGHKLFGAWFSPTQPDDALRNVLEDACQDDSLFQRSNEMEDTSLRRAIYANRLAFTRRRFTNAFIILQGTYVVWREAR